MLEIHVKAILCHNVNAGTVGKITIIECGHNHQTNTPDNIALNATITIDTRTIPICFMLRVYFLFVQVVETAHLM